jgi:hypothetical protein
MEVSSTRAGEATTEKTDDFMCDERVVLRACLAVRSSRCEVLLTSSDLLKYSRKHSLLILRVHSDA